MFRALSLSLLQDAIDTSDADAVAAYLPSVEIGFVHNAETNHDDVTLGGVNVEDEIRTPRVSAHIGTFV